MPPPFSPIAWYDASLQSEADGAPVASFTDQIGGFHAVQATEAAQPVLRVVGGRKFLRFSGAQKLAIPTSLSVDRRANSVFVAFRNAVTSNTNLTIIHLGAAAIKGGVLTKGLTYLHGLYAWASTSGIASNISGSNGVNAAGYTQSATASKVFCGREIATGVAPAAETVTGGWMGCLTGSGQYFVGDMAGAIIYDRTLTDGEAAEVLNWLSERHGSPASADTRVMVFEGDSLTRGLDLDDPESATAATNDYAWPATFQRALPRAMKYFNAGASGDTLKNIAVTTNAVQAIGSLAALANGAYADRYVCLLAGTNDLGAVTPESTATIKGYYDAWVTKLRAADATAKLIAITIPCRDDGGWSPTKETTRLEINSYLRANTSGFDQVFDLAAVPGFDVWDGDTRGYYGADKLHPTRSESDGKAAIADWFKGQMIAAGYIEPDSVDEVLTAESGALILSGGSAAMVVARRLAAEGGALALAGGTAVLSVARTMAAGAGALALSGGAAVLSVSGALVLSASAGLLTLSGGAATFRRGKRLAAEAGAISLSGGIATLRLARRLSAASGALVLAGGTATLKASTVDTHLLPLEAVKAYLRIDGDDEDATLLDLRDAAVAWVESYTGHLLSRRQVTEQFDGLTRIALDAWPVERVDAVTYLDPAGDMQVLPSTAYRLAALVRPAQVKAMGGVPWPATARGDDAVLVAVMAGYASPDAVPRDLRQAAMMVLAGLYAGREDGSLAEGTRKAAMDLCNRFRRWMVG